MACLPYILLQHVCVTLPLRGARLHQGQHFPGMCTGGHTRERMDNNAVLIDEIGDATGKARCPSTIGLTQDMVGITEERKGKARFLGKRFVRGHRIKAGPKDLHITLCKGVMEVTEPVPFRCSAASIGFGIKPQHHFFAAQVCQAHGRTIMRGDSKIRCWCSNCQHVCPPQ